MPAAPRSRCSHLSRTLLAAAAAGAVASTTSLARAQTDIRTPLGTKGAIILDDLAGFRASSVGGVGYSGPLGISTQSLSENIPSGNANATGGSDTFHYTTIWFAPELDYFVIDHLSIGGLIEIASTSSSFSESLTGASTTTTSLPTTTNVTVLPRVGWMVNLTDRWALWPRGGLGYAVRTTGEPTVANGGGVQTNSTDSFSGFVIDLDASLIFRASQMFFLRATPELTFVPGSHTLTNGNTSTSYGASLFDFTADIGLGLNWNL
jgi:hypothetical protein